eukprot:GHUV01041275.1.p1 GENE.GHUV01041275.1~~GHUV01041275.1.p1  ORF type:complete len:101 (-),score=6.66 GHUV01041275.1:577-879(-)
MQSPLTGHQLPWSMASLIATPAHHLVQTSTHQGSSCVHCLCHWLLVITCVACLYLRGQMMPLSASAPVEGPCQAVDFELEMVGCSLEITAHSAEPVDLQG